MHAERERSIRESTPVKEQISKSDLPLYLQAASASGFTVEVIAQEGKRVFDNCGSWRVMKGFVGIAILKSPAAEDHTPFWQTLEMLRDQQSASSPTSI